MVEMVRVRKTTILYGVIIVLLILLGGVCVYYEGGEGGGGMNLELCRLFNISQGYHQEFGDANMTLAAQACMNTGATWYDDYSRVLCVGYRPYLDCGSLLMNRSHDTCTRMHGTYYCDNENDVYGCTCMDLPTTTTTSTTTPQYTCEGYVEVPWENMDVCYDLTCADDECCIWLDNEEQDDMQILMGHCECVDEVNV